MGAETLERINIPGSPLYAVLCPNCSKMYQASEVEESNREGQAQMRVMPHFEDVPKTCKRCGSPMDFEDGGAYADLKAAETAGGTARGRRRGQKKQAAE